MLLPGFALVRHTWHELRWDNMKTSCEAVCETRAKLTTSSSSSSVSKGFRLFRATVKLEGKKNKTRLDDTIIHWSVVASGADCTTTKLQLHTLLGIKREERKFPTLCFWKVLCHQLTTHLLFSACDSHFSPAELKKKKDIPMILIL